MPKGSEEGRYQSSLLWQERETARQRRLRKNWQKKTIAERLLHGGPARQMRRDLEDRDLMRGRLSPRNPKQKDSK